jgi:cytochrome b involved in lipid metabolism
LILKRPSGKQKKKPFQERVGERESLTNNNKSRNRNRMPTLTKLYTMQEAAQHNTPQDCWVVIDGKVGTISLGIPPLLFSFLK